MIDGDQVLAACAISMQEDGTLTGDTVVATVMSNLGFHRAMQDHGIDVISAPVGDRYVLEQMLQHEVALGGEQSGHVIFRDQATTGDGLITAVRFLSLAARRGVPVGELAAAMRRFPQVLVNVEVAHKERLDDAREVWDAVRANEEALDGSGPGAGPGLGHRAARPRDGRGRERGARPQARGFGRRAHRVGPRLSGLLRAFDASRRSCYPRTSCAASWATWAPTRRFPSSSRVCDVSSTAGTTRRASR